MIHAARQMLRAPKNLRGPFETGAAALAALAGAGLIDDARAEERSSALPALTVDQPAARKIVTAPKPSKAHQRARAALRRATRAQNASAAPTAASPSASADPLQNLPGPSPYTRPGDPYMALRVASSKYTEPLIDTPRTITVLTKEIIADKNATSLKDLARTTAGVTLGTGEGGNAFGDRFFIRGFDARNDIFIDGVRDPGVSIRENFFTEQVEIMRGPGSSYAGRGTAGGAINIVPKMAQDVNFRSIEASYGTDATKRATFDVNQVLNSDLAVRAGGMLQGASISGRDTTTDDRNGAFASVKWTPGTSLIVTANYIHSYLNGIPDFGVPYYRASNAVTGAPVTELGVDRNAYYGFANRDFQTAQQDIGTLNAIYKVNENVQLSNKLRVSESTLDYIGTLPQSITSTNKANPLLWTVNTSPQSRYQTTSVVADQTEATIRFSTGEYQHALVAGTEISQESVSIDKYSGLSSEAYGSTSSGSGAITGVSLFYPQYTYLPFPNFNPTLSGNPTHVTVNTGSAYLIDTLNYHDKVYLNGGVRVDDYYINSWNASGANNAHSTLINYNLGALVKPTQETSLYAAWATSSNPVGAEVDATGSAYGGLAPTATNAVFGPELNTAAEIGAKAELFDRNLLATAALFNTTKTNARETNGSTVTAGAAYWVRGIDLELGGKITPQWSMFGGVVLMQSDVTASQTLPSNTAMYASNIGLPLANIAHQSFNLLTKYEIDSTWEVGGQATYRSQIYGGTLAANTGAVLPAYWRFDAFVEARLAKNLTAKLSVNNITNELYYDSFYRSLSPFVMVAPGRVALLSLNARF